MAKRPNMCGKSPVYIPDDDCSECMIEVNKLRQEMEECCDEVKDTLTDHDGRITTNENDINSLQSTTSNHGSRITALEDCCDEVRPQIQALDNRFSNYYTKSETYTQTQVDNLISEIQGSTFLEVDELPEIGEIGIIYLVDNEHGGKDQWIYSEYQSRGEWVNIGSTNIDMSDYVRIDQVVNMIHPVGDTVIRTDNVNPGTLYTGTTWQKISEGKVLIGADSTYPLGSSATGSMTHNHTNPTSGGPSTNTSGGPSTNTSGSTMLTANQSGVRNHNHTPIATTNKFVVSPSDIKVDNTKRLAPTSSSGWYDVYSATSGSTAGIGEDAVTGSTALAAAEGHTHTLSSHTHTLSSHTHTQGNTGDATIPYLAVNIWIRTA